LDRVFFRLGNERFSEEDKPEKAIRKAESFPAINRENLAAEGTLWEIE